MKNYKKKVKAKIRRKEIIKEILSDDSIYDQTDTVKKLKEVSKPITETLICPKCKKEEKFPDSDFRISMILCKHCNVQLLLLKYPKEKIYTFLNKQMHDILIKDMYLKAIQLTDERMKQENI